MLKIEIDSLHKKKEKYYFKEVPFSGIIFEMSSFFDNEKKEFEFHLCTDGVVLGKYKNPYIEKYYHNCKDCWEIHMGDYNYDYSDSVDVILYKDVLFSGLAYSHQDIDDVCFLQEEALFIDGIDEPRIHLKYNKDGNIVHFSTCILPSNCFIPNKEKFPNYTKLQEENSCFEECYQWADNGQIIYVKYDIYYTDFEMKLTKSGKITMLHISDDYAKHSDIIKKKANFHFFNNPTFFQQTSAGKELSLYSKGLTDDIFYNFYINNGLSSVESITFMFTRLTERSFTLLLSIPNISNIYAEIEEEYFQIPDHIISNLKDKNPSITIDIV